MYRSIDSLNTLGWKPDIILVNDDQATYSLLQSHHPLLHTVPIVFAGVSFPNWKLINQYKNITGFEDKPDILANLMLLSQIKETDKIVFTTLDVTFIDKKIRQEINKAVKGKKVVGFMTPNIPDSIQMDMAKNKGYILFQNYSLRVSNSTTPSFLWTVGHFGVGRSYLALKRDFTSPSIPRINNGFNFTAINEEFNEDQPLLGGYFSSMETQAKDQVDYAVKILKGASVSSLPICQSKKEYLFDWNAMKQIGLGVNDIPPYCKIINIPFNKKHPALYTSITVLLILVFVLSFFLFHLLFKRERRRKRAALATIAKERKFMKLALEGSNTFAWIMQDGILSFENSFWHFAHKEERTMRIETLVPYIHPSYQNLLIDFFNSAEDKKSIQLRASLDKKNYNWWDVRCTVSRLGNGKTRTSGVIFDIQSFKDTEEELKKARILAEKAEMKQSFIANINHEIRTPLNAIMGFTSLLTDSNNLTKEDQEKYIAIIKENNKELLNLVDEVLLLTEIDSGTLMFKTEKFSIQNFLEKEYSDFAPKVPANLEFINIKNDRDINISTDPNHLADVLVHILDNAVKFTSTGSIKLGYQYIADTKEIEIYVEDTGHGIPEDELHLIFTRFYKRDIFKQGVGLGLSVCKTIVEKLNGRLLVKSKVEEGSRFSIILPCSEKIK
jgi:signal transduction histidine kinase